MKSQFNFFKNTDRIIILLYLCLIFIGWISVYAAEIKETHESIFDFSQSYGKQFVWILTSLVLGTIILTIDAKFFPAFAYLIFGAVFFLLVGVLAIGNTVNASKSWIQIGGFNLQPAELAKYATALALSRIIYDIKTKNITLKELMKPAMIIALPMAMIFLQNDTGSALVFSAFVIVLYREGFVPGWVLLLGIFAIFLFILTLLFNQYIIMAIVTTMFLVTAFMMRKKGAAVKQLLFIMIAFNIYVYGVDYTFDEILQPHQKMRIAVLIDETVDLRGAGYNLHQSKIAIGSGGLTGKGFLQGTQTKFSFVPEQGTDFIFCTVGEEWGFIGSTFLIALYLSMLVRIVILADRQRSVFSRVFGYSLASVMFFHFTINIGMTIGLIPVIGIPLPFISYGGSSLWAFTIFLFTFLKLDSRRLELI